MNSIGFILNKATKDIEAANNDELKDELKDFMEIHSSKLNKTKTGEIRQDTEKIGGRTTYFTDTQTLFI